MKSTNESKSLRWQNPYILWAVIILTACLAGVATFFLKRYFNPSGSDLLGALIEVGVMAVLLVLLFKVLRMPMR